MDLGDLSQGCLHRPTWGVLDAATQDVETVEPCAVGALVPAKGILDRGEVEWAGRLKLETNALLDLPAEPLDTAILNRVLEARVLAVGTVAEITLGGENSRADLVHLVCRNKTEEVSKAREGLRIAVTHAEAASDGHIVSDEFSILDDRDIAEILREDIDVIGRGDCEAGLEFAWEIGVTIHRLNLGFATSNEFLVKVDLMIGTGFGEGIVAPVCRVLIDLLEDLRTLGIRWGHDITVHVAACSDRVEQDLVHSFDEFLHVPLENAVELEGLACRQSQGGGGNGIGQLIEDDPLLWRGLSAGETDAEHEGESLLLAFFLECVAKVAVILHVETMEFSKLVTLLADIPRGGVGEVGGDGSTKVVGVDLISLVCGEGFRSSCLGAHWDL